MRIEASLQMLQIVSWGRIEVEMKQTGRQCRAPLAMSS